VASRAPSASGQGTESPRPRQRAAGIAVDVNACHGCGLCMIACSMVHEGQAAPSRARLSVDLNSFTGQHSIAYCRQCRRAACAEACPEEAIQRGNDGVWRVEDALCSGCGACVEACPFQAIWVSELTGTAIKCDACGGEPACVAICPSQALSWPGDTP